MWGVVYHSTCVKLEDNLWDHVGPCAQIKILRFGGMYPSACAFPWWVILPSVSSLFLSLQFCSIRHIHIFVQTMPRKLKVCLLIIPIPYIPFRKLFLLPVFFPLELHYLCISLVSEMDTPIYGLANPWILSTTHQKHLNKSCICTEYIAMSQVTKYNIAFRLLQPPQLQYFARTSALSHWANSRAHAYLF